MRFIFIIVLLLSVHCLNAQPLKREMRGAWLTTFLNIDWPDRTQSPQQQRESLISILNTYHNIGINTVFLQIRSQCDAMYQSNFEPWSADLTGVQGMAPFPLWDPLKFAIEECHKRAIEIHGWMNPYRAVANTANLPNFAPTHIARTHPEWLLNNGTLRTLDPGLPEVREYIVKIVKDVVNRYDLDGIHFDDYFYPEGFVNDEATFSKYPNGITSKADWRRNNVNLLIKTLGTEINALKPWMKFGISPSGIYRNSTNPEIGSPTNGLEHYNTLFSDSKKWLQEGWIDYLIPQVYYSSRQTSAPYPTVVQWWQQHSYHRHIYIGIGSYKIGNGETAWSNRSETPNQIRLNRTYKNIKGQSFYNTASIMNNRLGLKDSLFTLFNPIALPPEMPWKKTEFPQVPVEITAIKNGNEVSLTWRKPPFTNELNKPMYFVLYRSLNQKININDAKEIIALTADTSFTDQTSTDYYYAVTSLNRTFNESEVSETVSASGSKIPFTYVLNWMMEKNNEVKLRWKDHGLDTIRIFELEKSLDGINYQIYKTVNVIKRNDEYLVNDIIHTNTFYRLKSMKVNGQSDISKAVEIKFTPLLVVKVDTTVKPLIASLPVKSVASNNNVIKKDTIPAMVQSLSGAKNNPSPVNAISINQKTDSTKINIRSADFLVYPLAQELKAGVNLSIRINVAGNLIYRVFENDRQLTWGKIKTGRSNVTLSLPGTNELKPGKYVLKMEMDQQKQEIPFELR